MKITNGSQQLNATFHVKTDNGGRGSQTSRYADSYWAHCTNPEWLKSMDQSMEVEPAGKTHVLSENLLQIQRLHR
jgi:hypothetical protein